MLIKDRAKYLTRNFLLKILSEDSTDLKVDLDIYVNKETLHNSYHPWRNLSIIAESWQRCNKDKNLIINQDKLRLFNLNFWTITNGITTEISLGRRHNGDAVDVNKFLSEIKEAHKLKEDCLIIYTDGSKIEKNDSTGSAFYIDNLEQGFYMSLHKYCNNYTAEGYAVAKVLQWLYSKKFDKDILILTDSLSIIKSLQNNMFSSKTNEYVLEIRQWYFKLTNSSYRSDSKIVIGWIPAHKGIHKRNETADGLAKLATKDPHSPSLIVPIRDIRKIYKKEFFIKTIEYIKHQARYKGKHYFQDYFRENEYYPWFQDFNAPRRFVVLINRLRADHYKFI